MYMYVSVRDCTLCTGSTYLNRRRLFCIATSVKQEAQILFFFYFMYYFLHKLLHIPFVKLQKLFDSSMFCKPCVYSGVKSNKMRS